MPQVTVRQAIPDDVEGIVPLWQEMTDFNAALDPRMGITPEGAEHFRQFLLLRLEDDNSCVLIAEVEGRIVGYTIGRVVSNPPVFSLSEYAYISDMCVTEGWRRRGIGRRLYQALCEWFRAKGLSVIQLSTLHHNPVSQAFWRAMGFSDYLDRLWCEIT